MSTALAKQHLELALKALATAQDYVVQAAKDLEHVEATLEADRQSGPPAKWSPRWVEKELDERAAMRDPRPMKLPLRECSLCRTTLGYVVYPVGHLPRDEPRVYFRSACNCTSRSADAPDRPSSFDEISRVLSMQDSDEIREHLWNTLTRGEWQ